LPNLRQTLLTVIENGTESEHEFHLDFGRYLMRITPYLSEFARPVGAMLTFIDLSHIQQTESALEESNTTLRAVLDNVFDGIVVTNESGIIESFNSAAERIFGYTADEAVGQNVTLLQPEPHRSLHNKYIKNYIETGQAKIIGIGREVTGQRKNGHTFPMDLAVTEMWAHGQRKFVGIARDLTAERKKQTAR